MYIYFVVDTATPFGCHEPLLPSAPSTDRFIPPPPLIPTSRLLLITVGTIKKAFLTYRQTDRVDKLSFMSIIFTPWGDALICSAKKAIHRPFVPSREQKVSNCVASWKDLLPFSLNLFCPEAEFMNVQFRWGFWAYLESSHTWGCCMDVLIHTL